MRYINIEKLLDVKQIKVPNSMSRNDLIQKFALAKMGLYEIVGKIRPMEEKDTKEVLRLYNLKNEKHSMYFSYSKKEI